MNPSPPEASGWSRRRWMGTILAVTGAQVLLLWYLGQGHPSHRPSAQRPPTISLVADAWQTEQLLQLPTLRDPTLFALPHLHGFSAEAWLRFVPLQNPLPVWQDPIRWIPLESNRLGEVFTAFAKTNVQPPRFIADEAVTSRAVTDAFVTNQPVRARSVLQVDSPLATRPLLEPVNLPSLEHNDVLRPSLVQVAVRADGTVLTAVLLRSSGLATADARALEEATHARFEPLTVALDRSTNHGEEVWGQLTFCWHTVPIAASPPPPVAR